MYLPKSQIEVKVFEAINDTIFYNGKNIDEVLPIEERALICVNVMESLPPTMPDLIRTYHKDRKLGDDVEIEKVYYHLLEEVIELGFELNISRIDIYEQFAIRLNNIPYKSNSRESLINELADVSTIVGSIAEYVKMGDILYDAILIVKESNDSKICNLEQVEQTVKENNLSNSSVRTKELGNNKYLMVDEDTGKSIKPVGYKPPNFKHLFK